MSCRVVSHHIVSYRITLKVNSIASHHWLLHMYLECIGLLAMYRDSIASASERDMYTPTLHAFSHYYISLGYRPVASLFLFVVHGSAFEN